MTTAGIFPGQGSEYPGMLQGIKAYPVTQDIFSSIREISGKDIFSLALGGPEDELKKPVHAQLAVFGTSAAYWHLLHGQESFSVIAGHSLGFYSALYAAGSLSLEDCIRLIIAVQHLIEASSTGGKGAMASIIGMKTADVERICAQSGEVFVSNVNSATQTVISGREEHMGRACTAARESGALQVRDLAIPYPLHSPLMNGIEESLRTVVGRLSIRRPLVPVISHMDSRQLNEQEMAGVLCSQLTGRVLWHDTMRAVLNAGVKRFVEIGPSAVLSRIVRWIDRDAEAVPAEEILSCQSV